MNKELAIETIVVLDKLVQRAVKIASRPPYGECGRDEAQFAKLGISDDGIAVLRWPRVEIWGEDSTLETEEVSFPARFLFISDVELAAWQLEQKNEYECRQAQRIREYEQRLEAKERAEFERLKARYG